MKKAVKIRMKKNVSLYIMSAIVLAFFLVFCYGPMYGILIGFKEFNPSLGILGSPWAEDHGLYYFRKFLTDSKFWEVTRNTLIFSALRLIFVFPAPIVVALLINEIRCKYFKKGVETVIYLPRFISWVIVSGLITGLLSPNTGLFNEILRMFGKEPVDFIIEEKYFRAIVIISDIWKSAGWGSIVYAASIAGIDQTLYEAAEIDGAGRFRKMWHISLACIKPTILMMLILQLSNILNGGFDQIYVLYTPLTYSVADIIDTYVYRMAISAGEFEYSTAVGLFKSVIGLAMILIADRACKLCGERGII